MNAQKRSTNRLSNNNDVYGNNDAIDPFYGKRADVIKNQHQSNLFICILVLIWYCTAVVTITSTKEVMNRLPFPFLLCACQFFFASLLSLLYLHNTSQYKKVPSALNSLVSKISATYTLGFVLTNLAFKQVSAGIVETLKSAEPLSTVLIGYILMNDTYTYMTYATLIPICCGVAISCYNNDSINMFGLLFAIGSNLCFSGRSVLTKVMISKAANTNPNYSINSYDEINLFAAISIRGLLFLLPITVIIEGTALFSVVQSTIKSGNNGELIISNSETDSSTSLLTILVLLFMNGVTFACYNLMSYLVLKRTELVTHSVLNVFRRVFIILFTTVYFHTILSPFAVGGVIIAIAGVLLFGCIQRRSSS